VPRRFAVEGEADSFSAGGEYRGDADTGEDQLAGDLGLRIGEHLAHRAELGDLATVDDGHAVADLVNNAHLVRDDDHCDAHCAVDLLEKREDRLRCRGVKRARRLVAEKVAGLRCQRAGDGYALLLSAGELRGIRLGAVGETDDGEKLHSALHRLLFLPSSDLQRVAHVLENGALREKIEALEDHPDRAADEQQLLLGELGEILAVYDYGAGGRTLQQVDAPDERGFARAGKTDDTEYFSVLDREGNVMHGVDLPFALAEVLGHILKLNQKRTLLTNKKAGCHSGIPLHKTALRISRTAPFYP